MKKVEGRDGIKRDVNVISNPAYDDGIERTFHLIGLGAIQKVTQPFEAHEEEGGFERRHYLWFAKDEEKGGVFEMYAVSCAGLFRVDSPLMASIDIENCDGHDWHYMYAVSV